MSRALLGQDRIAEAIRVLETARTSHIGGVTVLSYLGYAYARAGRHADAEHLAAIIPPMNVFTRAVIFAGLRDKDRSFDALEQATFLGPIRIGWALGEPEYALLRGDPRESALRRKVSLPP